MTQAEQIFALAALVLLLGGVLVGALVAAGALLLGLQAGVRIRQGLEPTALLPTLRQFLEKYVHGREAAAATGAAPAAGKAEKGEPEKADPRGVRPQVRM